jgi:hypothetical protein
VTVSFQFVFKLLNCQHSSVKPIVFGQKVKAPLFKFFIIMAQLRFYWVSDRGYQRLAILAIRENLKLVKLALTELEPHYATDDFVNFNSIDQVVASVVYG